MRFRMGGVVNVQFVAVPVLNESHDGLALPRHGCVQLAQPLCQQSVQRAIILKE